MLGFLSDFQLLSPFCFGYCLFLGVAYFGCFGFACISSFCFVCHGMVLMETFNDSRSTPLFNDC